MTEKELLNYCGIYSHILCYGAGLFGKITRIYLHEHGIDISAFLVSKITNGQKDVLEKQVFQISDYPYNRNEHGILLCANETIRYDMEILLQEYGITDYFVVDKELVEILDHKNQYSTIFRTKGVKTLLYHRVADLDNDIWRLAVKPKAFEAHIKYLKDNYRIVRFEEEWSGEEENTISITFDDGYYDNYKNALPILEKYKVPATIFICTGNMETDREFWWDELENIFICGDNQPSKVSILGEVVYLNHRDDSIKLCYRVREEILKMKPDERMEFMDKLKQQVGFRGVPRDDYRTVNYAELRALDKSQWITIGGHTVTHSKLTSETEEQQMQEIKESKRVIENIIGHPITVFSYPFGSRDDYDIVAIDIAKEVGYKKIAAVEMRYEAVKMYNVNVPRIGVQQPTYKDYSRNLRRVLSLS